MKNNSKNIAIILGSSVIATLLFYKQGIGINAGIFSILIIASLLLKKKVNANNWFTPLLLVINSIALCLSFQWLSFVLFIFSLLLVVGSHHPKIKNYFFSLIQAIPDLFSSFFILVFKKNEEEFEKTYNSNKIIAISVTIPFVILFFILYSSGNPVFSLYLSKIDLSFIDFGTIIFFLFACVFCTPIFLGSKKDSFAIFLNPTQLIQQTEIETDKTETTIFNYLFIALSIILTLFHLSDLSLIVMGGLPKEMTMSEYLHQGFWTLVISVILSVILVVFFFRDQLGFHTSNKQFKTIASIWLSLNGLLLLSTGIKNCIYVFEYGLTYKRIAVFIFLGLAFILIVSCLIKIFKSQLFSHFVGVSFVSFMVFLSSAGIAPWDSIITNYNLNMNEGIVDLDYLIHLKNNSYELYQYSNSDRFNSEQKDLIHIKTSIKSQIVARKTWQEWNWTISKEKQIPLDTTHFDYYLYNR